MIIEWNAKLISRDFNVDFKNLVSQYNVGIDMDNVVAGMVLAKENNLPITFDQACEADAKGIDLVKTVKNRISYVD